MNKRNRKPAIGESFQAWSGDDAATLRNLIDELQWFGPRRFADEISRCRECLAALADPASDLTDWPDQFENCIDVACEALTAWAQERNPYIWFGANPHYPESFGFWPDADAARDNADWIGDGFGEWPRGFSGLAIVVNDHGNMTAYRVSRGRKYQTYFSVV